MNSPARVISIHEMNDPFVSEMLYRDAKRLFDNEDFSDSVSLLKNAIDEMGAQWRKGGVPLKRALALLAWNFVALRDFPAWTELEKTLSSLGLQDQADFELIRIWFLTIAGDIREAINRANAFLDGQEPNIHALHPDFLTIRGHCFSLAGHADLPVRDCEAAYSIFLLQGREFESAKAANALGLHLFKLGQYLKSKDWLSRAEDIFAKLNLSTQISVVSLNLGLVYYKIGKLDKSQELLEESLRIGIEGGWIHRQCFANIALGNVLRMKRNFAAARRHLMNGYKQAKTKSMSREEALALEFLGDIYRDEGNITEAQHLYSRALVIVEPRAPEGDIVSEVQRRIGECHLLQGDRLQAEPHLNKALALTRRQGDRFEEAVTLRILAESARLSGEAYHALDHISLSCAILDEIGAHYELAISRLLWGRVLLAGAGAAQGNKPVMVDLNQAWTQGTEALKLFLTMDIPWWTTQASNLVKQVSAQRLQREKIEREQAVTKSRGQGRGSTSGVVIIQKSPVMARVLDLCDLYAPNDSPVLIQGETGTGKELLARRLHDNSGRSGRLIAVNVASISPALFEREFFGHVKGAFSGADRSCGGFAEHADQGTLFLDEIGDLPLELQPKLLRLLQEGTFHAVGDPTERSVNLRFVAATNMDLFAATQKGFFREDLFYRLQMLSVNVPALRDRPEDILPLMEHFLSTVAGRQVELGEYINLFSQQLAQGYTWPGNVREIISVCQQLHLQVTTRGVGRVELGPSGNTVVVLRGPGFLEMAATAGESLGPEESRRERLIEALRKTSGNRQAAALYLQISRSTLYRQMKRYQL